MAKTIRQAIANAVSIATIIAAPAWLAGEAAAGQIKGPLVSAESTPLSSVPIRQLKPASAPQKKIVIRPRLNPLRNTPDQGRRGTWDRGAAEIDPLIMNRVPSRGPTPAPLLTFEGTGNPVGCGGCSPPDTNGDVGPNHYVQIVNATKVAIYDKAGTLLVGPVSLSSFWPSGTCSLGDDGDPVALYDPLADRWLLSQFLPSANGVCIAVSQTPDPTGAYFLYEFATTDFPDYFKFGVWPDGYYMGTNENTYTAYAFDRRKMLKGKPATFLSFSGGENFLMPADIDGKSQPAAGSPGVFYTFLDNKFHGGSDRIEVYELHADFAVPANSTFSLRNAIPVASFKYTACGFFNLDCAKQKGTTRRVDVVSEWPMFRFPYRKFSSFEALAGTFTVGGGLGQVGAAVRWFELHKSGANWTLFQQGTIDPGDGNDRFMSSIAMDKNDNLAVGYSVSSRNLFPSIRYSVHRVADAPGTMRGEATLIAGGGSQTVSNRWGDYSAMTVDPSDERTFWFTSEYYPVSSGSNWKTRIGKFRAR